MAFTLPTNGEDVLADTVALLRRFKNFVCGQISENSDKTS